MEYSYCSSFLLSSKLNEMMKKISMCLLSGVRYSCKSREFREDKFIAISTGPYSVREKILQGVLND